MGESKFTGGLLGLIGKCILACLLSVVTLGIGIPWAVCMIVKWFVKHINIDGKKYRFDGAGGKLFGKYIVWFLLSIVTFGIYSFWLGVNMVKWVVQYVHCVEEAAPAPAPAVEA